jgi:hypothetical protein
MPDTGGGVFKLLAWWKNQSAPQAENLFFCYFDTQEAIAAALVPRI